MKSIRDTQSAWQTHNGFVCLGVVAWLILPLACAQSNPVQIENTKPGTADWQLTNPASNREIEGYASATSVNRGGQILFFVNTAEPSYQIEVFRVGWYGGLGARQVITPIMRTGTPQVTPSPDPVTGMIECNWSDPYVLTIPNTPSDPSDWASGVYLARLTAATSGKQAYIVFVVRDDSRASDILFQSAVTTYQAYNNWGGKSLYSFNSTGTQAVKVSFNRPYVDGDGAGYFLSWEIYMLRFLEREGQDVTYVTSIDMHANAALINSHKVFLSVGHDEYWSWQIRSNFEAARDHGDSLGFFAANVGYWQVRLDPSPITGDPYRTQVCYKDRVTTSDPVLLDGDPSNDYLATTLFRNSPVNRPEDALIGVMYGQDPVSADIVIQNPSHWIFSNTGVNAGDHLAGLLGYEVDWMQGNAPQGTILLAHSPVPNTSNAADMTVYTATSGATVFATGSIQFSWGLDDYGARGLVNTAAQQMTRNFFAHALGPDTTPPTIVSVRTGGPTTVIVVFSEPVASVSATTGLNYTIDHGQVVNGASLGSDLETVMLSTSALSAGVLNTLTVNNVQDIAGNSIAPNSQIQFTYFANTATASADYRAEVLSDSPLSYWRLGESTGTSAVDVMGVNPGMYTGGYILGQEGALSGDLSTAVLLNGTTGVVSVPASGWLDLGDGPLTLEAWVKRTSTNRNDIIIHKGTGAYQLLLTTGNRLALTKANTATIVQSTKLVSDTAWHYVAATKNAATVKLYLDGVDVTGTVTNQTLANATSSTLRLGTDNLTFFNGVLDEVAIYNKELSPERIAVHYAASALPAAPNNLTATGISTSQINLSWTNNAKDVTGFTIERAPDGVDGVSFIQIGTVAAGATSYSDMGLNPVTTYDYRVKAYNTGGDSGYSNIASAATTADVPAAPSALTASAASSSQINLAWIDNGNREDGFKIERSVDGINFSQIAVVGIDLTSYSDTGLSSGVNYYYRVRSYNGVGNSAYSNTVMATTQGATVSYSADVLADTPVSYWRLGETSGVVAADVMGRNPATYGGGFTLGQPGALSGNSNTAVLLNGTTGFASAPNSTSLSLADGPLTLEAWVKRNSINRTDIIIHKGTGTYQLLLNNSNHLALAKANTATIVQSTKLVADTAWHHVVGIKNGAVAKLYLDGVDVTGTVTNQTLIDATSSTLRLGTDSSTFFNGVLDEVAIYNYVLSPQRISLHYAASGLPAAPSALAANAMSSSQIDLAWTDNASNEAGFNIERSPDGITFMQIDSTAPNATSYSDTGLPASTTYYYRVRSFNTSGASVYSSVANATTGVTLPTAPSALSATAVSSSQISLAWTDNSSNEDGFQIERSPDGVTFTLIAAVATSTTSYLDTGLSAATTYAYRVRAYNTSGNSAYSNTASATTNAIVPAVPAAPSALNASAVSTSQINLSWTDNSTNEDGFQIERSPDGVSFTQIGTAAANATSFSDTGLTAATTYTYRVRAYNTGGNSVYSNNAGATTSAAEPAAPSAMSATAVSTSQINLTWTDNSTNEDGFEIERSPDGVTFSPLTTVAANVTTYVDMGLNAGTTYHYRVRAYNVAGASAYSNSASATTVGPLIAPSDLSATAISTTRIDLAWMDNSSNEDEFAIERSSDNVTFAQVAVVGANTTSYSDTGLTASTTYYYRVRATSAVNGNSPYSNTATGTTVGVLAAPGSLTATTASTSQINLSWIDNSANEDGFKIEQSTDNVSFTQIETVGANVTTYSNTGLITSTTYYYRVRATSALNGDSTYSNIASATTAGPLAAPSNLIATAISNSQINLAWTDNSSTEDGFKIEQSTDNVNFTPIAVVGTNVTTYSNAGLNDATTYYYRVRATSTVSGDSNYSNTAQATTSAAVPLAPSALSATAVSASQINLAWTDNANNEDGFKVERSPDGVSFTQIATTVANATGYSDTGLTASTTYYYRVRAYNTGGDSAYSSTASATTKVVPASPSGLTAIAASASRINLAWRDNSTNETGFTIERSLDGASFIQIATVGASVTTYANTGLAAGTTYYYRARATNANGDSGYSNLASAATAAPAAPTTLTATPIALKEIDLNWTDNSSDETTFLIERSTDNITFNQIASVGTNVTSYANTGLTAGKTYYYRVRAQNAVGKSGYSNTASATTLNPPKAPSSLSAKAISSGQVNLTWQDNSNNEIGFKIERSTNGTAFTQITVVGANVRSFADTGLTSNTKYQYRVRSYNADGDSAYSNTVSATTLN